MDDMPTPLSWTRFVRPAISLYVATIPLGWLAATVLPRLRSPRPLAGEAGLLAFPLAAYFLFYWVALVFISLFFWALAAATAFNHWRWVLVVDGVLLFYGPLSLI